MAKKKVTKKKNAPKKKAVKKAQAPKKKIAKKAKPRKILRIINIKARGKSYDKLRQNARAFAQGNLSAWLRHAGLKYVPKKGEKIQMPTNYGKDRK